MTTEELIRRIDEKEYKENEYDVLEEFIEENGIENIKTKDLDKIINKYGAEIFSISYSGLDVMKLYGIISARESGKTMNRLTWWIFIFTLITTTATVYNIFYL